MWWSIGIFFVLLMSLVLPILIRGMNQLALVSRLEKQGADINIYYPRPVWLSEYLGDNYRMAFGEIGSLRHLEEVSEEDFEVLATHPIRSLEIETTIFTDGMMNSLGQMRELESL
ncbi:MAG TPA: hypothetical protein VLA12_21105, partial [Planctomycetaceae bacterium]|nr:hypothetical protein [Planctomycetaceae bacterium]